MALLQGLRVEILQHTGEKGLHRQRKPRSQTEKREKGRVCTPSGKGRKTRPSLSTESEALACLTPSKIEGDL